MGQICHPTAFRLGHNLRWNAGYFPSREDKHKFFQYNLFVSKLLKNIFVNYTTPNYSYTEKRNYRNEQNELITIGERGNVHNPLQSQGIYFSHSFSSKFSGALIINIFLLDQGFLDLKKRFYEDYRIKKIFYHRDLVQRKKLKYKFFTNHFGFGRLKRRYRIYKRRQIKFIKKRRTWENRNRPWHNKWFNFRVMRAKLSKAKMNPLGVFDFITNNLNPRLKIVSNEYAPFRQYAKLIKIYLRLLKINKEYKKQLFFVKSLQHLLVPFIKILRGRHREVALLQKLFFFLSLIEISILKVSSYLKTLVYRLREPIYHTISAAIAMNLQAAMIPNLFNRYKVSFYGLQLQNINPHIILNFIIFRLSQYIPINPILNEQVNKLRRNSNEIRGFKILVTGRLTRKERASIILRSRGLVSPSRKDCKLE